MRGTLNIVVWGVFGAGRLNNAKSNEAQSNEARASLLLENPGKYVATLFMGKYRNIRCFLLPFPFSFIFT